MFYICNKGSLLSPDVLALPGYIFALLTYNASFCYLKSISSPGQRETNFKDSDLVSETSKRFVSKTLSPIWEKKHSKWKYLSH